MNDTGAPLAGVRVVVTRARAGAVHTIRLLEERGATVIVLPTIQIENPADWRPVDVAARKLASGLYEWVVFFSANAVERFFIRLDALGLDARAFVRTKVAAVGRVTAHTLRAHGIRADLVPEEFTAAALAAGMGFGSGKVLLPRAVDAPRAPVGAIQARHWTVEQVEVYRNVMPSVIPPEVADVRAGEFDVLTFTSPSAARNFVQLLGAPSEMRLAPDVAGTGDVMPKVVCIGPATRDAAEALGFRVDAVPGEHTAEGIADAIAGLVGAGLSAPEARPPGREAGAPGGEREAEAPFRAGAASADGTIGA
ncbi:MAG: uroporphyrinogen-III synthase [Actinomycetota bacterium]